ncbi:PH domain-containing protein [Georgenia sp. AZ-5]|uniref:PH domain-containing protein n=1 Tax=Georgenia sp. AZ-5 TaxID=3367526 RepID=UPI003753EDC1
MAPTVVFRPTSSRVYAVVCWVVAAVVLGAFAANGGPAELIRYGALPLALATFGWAVFWQPHVTVRDAGVEVGNVFSTVHLPWTAIRGVETRWGLKVLTRTKGYAAWAAPRAGRSRLRSRQETDAAAAGRPTCGASPGGDVIRSNGDADTVAAFIDDRLGQVRDPQGPAAGTPGAARVTGMGPIPGRDVPGPDGVRASLNTPAIVLMVGSIALAVLSWVLG